MEKGKSKDTCNPKNSNFQKDEFFFFYNIQYTFTIPEVFRRQIYYRYYKRYQKFAQFQRYISGRA